MMKNIILSENVVLLILRNYIKFMKCITENKDDFQSLAIRDKIVLIYTLKIMHFLKEREGRILELLFP
jgi:hypothetical protein